MNNIIKRKWNQNSMVIIEDLQGMAFQAESGGHTFQISGIDGEGNAVALSGTPAGVMLRADGQDVTLTCSASEGVISATLPANAYSVPGRFGLTIFLTSDGQKTAIYAAVGTVGKTSSGTVAPPAGSDVVTLVNQINTAIAAIPANYNACFAPAYSTSGLYSVGQYVTYNGNLYRCNTAITTAETWTAAHWTQTNLGADVYDLKSALINVDNGKNTLLTDNVLSYSDEVRVTGTSTYQRSPVQSFSATPGTKYTLKIASVTGNKDSVVGVLRTKDSGGTVIDSGNLTASAKSIEIIASTGSVTVEFYLAGSHGTAMAGDTAVFKEILLVSGASKKIHLRNDIQIDRLDSAENNITELQSNASELQGDMSDAEKILKITMDNLAEIVSTNIIVQYGDISVTGTSTYTQYIIDITDFTVGLRYNIVSDRVVGNKDNNKFIGRLFSGETIEKTEMSSSNRVAVTPTSNTTKIRFILTASNGTSMAGDTAVYYNTRIYTGAYGSEYYKVGYAETAGEVEQVSEMTLLRSMKLQTVMSVAHRGKMDEAPMCTAPAYIAARKHLCEWGENDLNITYDGEWVMWHDDNLYRLGTYVKDIHGYDLYKLDSTYYWVNGTTVYDLNYETVSISVSSLTHVAANTVSITGTDYDVLKNVDFGSWFSSNFAGTKILTLKEWLILCKGLGLGVYIHFKSAFTSEQIQEIIGIVKTCGMLENAVFLGASSTVASIREYAPYNRIGVVWYADDSLVSSLRQYLVPSVPNSVFFDPDISNLTTARHEKAKSNGFGSECYYVEWASGTSEETIFQTIQNAVDLGVDGITLDNYRVDEAMFNKYFSE